LHNRQKGIDDITAAAAALAAGKLVAMPTETVYGLAADACNDNAVASVYAAKGRPQFNPLIIHVLDRAMAERYAAFDPVSARLAEAFWPGPLTLVLPRRPHCPLSLLVSAGLDTVALRAPAHPVARALIAAFDGPVAAPSANRSGHISPTRLKDALEELGDAIAVGLDGGPCAAGLESTIVAVRDGGVDILRPGPITVADIERVAGVPARAPRPSGPVEAPGQLQSHYAPRAAVRLQAAAPKPGEAFLAFGPAPAAPGPMLNLSPTGDLKEAASNLFSYLRQLDASGAPAIAVMPIPDEGLGVAINDRLCRAAAPRDGRLS
jgi:L-threonylcarbamoyladenylate synthase